MCTSTMKFIIALRQMIIFNDNDSVTITLMLIFASSSAFAEFKLILCHPTKIHSIVKGNALSLGYWECLLILTRKLLDGLCLFTATNNCHGWTFSSQV